MQFIEQLPIASASPEQKNTVERLVDQILSAKKPNPEADVSALERQIDELVYGLYDLTPEEIQIVEGAAKMKISKGAYSRWPSDGRSLSSRSVGLSALRGLSLSPSS